MITMSDPILDNAELAGGQLARRLFWTPNEFKKAIQQDHEHLDRKMNSTPFQEVITTRQAILDEAKAAITGEREDAYGGPEQSFTTIAKFWSAYLDHFIETQDVAAMLGIRLKPVEWPDEVRI